MSSLLLYISLACSGAEQGASSAAQGGAEAKPEADQAEQQPADRAAVDEPADGWTHFGEAFTVEETVAAADVLAAPDGFVDKSILVEGRVTQVCQKAGCWMVVAEGDKSMRVLMKDHGFAVDKNAAGSDCRVEGTVVAKAKDPEAVAHFKSESEDPTQVPEEQMGDTVYELVATGVAIRADATEAAGVPDEMEPTEG